MFLLSPASSALCHFGPDAAFMSLFISFFLPPTSFTLQSSFLTDLILPEVPAVLHTEARRGRSTAL